MQGWLAFGGVAALVRAVRSIMRESMLRRTHQMFVYGLLAVADGLCQFGRFVAAHIESLVQIDVIFQQVVG